MNCRTLKLKQTENMVYTVRIKAYLEPGDHVGSICTYEYRTKAQATKLLRLFSKIIWTDYIEVRKDEFPMTHRYKKYEFPQHRELREMAFADRKYPAPEFVRKFKRDKWYFTDLSNVTQLNIQKRNYSRKLKQLDAYFEIDPRAQAIDIDKSLVYWRDETRTDGHLGEVITKAEYRGRIRAQYEAYRDNQAQRGDKIVPYADWLKMWCIELD